MVGDRVADEGSRIASDEPAEKVRDILEILEQSQTGHYVEVSVGKLAAEVDLDHRVRLGADVERGVAVRELHAGGEDSSQSLVAGSEVGNSQATRHVGAKRLGIRGEQLDSGLCTLFPPRRCCVAEIERQRLSPPPGPMPPGRRSPLHARSARAATSLPSRR